jgi:hypothetical protein
MDIKEHQLSVLRLICAQAPLPVSQCDGRVLRPLLRLNLVAEAGDRIYPTAKGHLVAAQDRSQPPARNRTPVAPPTGLSESQEEILRYLVRQPGPVPTDHVDGRVLRALLSRALVEERDGWVSPTDNAAPSLRSHIQKHRQRSARRAADSPRGARGEAIMRVVEELEKALPRGAELMIADIPAYGDDVVAGLRRFVREMG